MRIALGPLQYYWPREKIFGFYECMAHTPVDIVYLGETVCSRRHEMRLADWLDVASRLHNAGKEVVLSTQVLLESGSDVAAMRKIVRNGDYAVEANDMGAVHCLAGQTGFVAGPHLNIYNAQPLTLIARQGASRWVMPLEMGSQALALMQRGRPQCLETEVFVYGRLPLAYSARCFTARHRNLPKDDCRFSCQDYPEGLTMRTQESEHFLVLNGTQTQSARIHNLISEMGQLAALGVDVVRLSPQSHHMAEVIALFHAAATGAMATADAAHALAPLLPGLPCNGYWHGRPGLEQVDAPGTHAGSPSEMPT